MPGDPPAVPMVVLAAALGVGVHFLCALPGLVPTTRTAYATSPLIVALKIGATRLLAVSLAWTALSLVGLLLVGNAVGLGQWGGPGDRPLGWARTVVATREGSEDALRRSARLSTAAGALLSPPRSLVLRLQLREDRPYTPGAGHQRPGHTSTCSAPWS